jgi:hypothetical protein
MSIFLGKTESGEKFSLPIELPAMGKSIQLSHKSAHLLPKRLTLSQKSDNLLQTAGKTQPGLIREITGKLFQKLFQPP